MGTGRSANTDAVRSETTQRTTTLLEKVVQTAQKQAERKVLQHLQTQIEHKTILTKLSDMQRFESVQATNNILTINDILSTNSMQSTAKLIRIPITTSNQVSNPTSVSSSSPWINSSDSIYSINQTVNSLHHIEQSEAKRKVRNKQVALAKVLLSPYIRNIVREEQERITAELAERNNRARTKATLHGLVPPSHTPSTAQSLTLTTAQTARKALLNKLLSTSMEQRHSKITKEQILILRQQKHQLGYQPLSRKSLDYLSQINSAPHVKSSVQTNTVQRGKTVTQANRAPNHSTTNRQTIINDMKYYLKTTAHYINSIKYYQRMLQNEQKLVYIPFVNRNDAGVNEKVKLIYRNLLTQVDSRISNNQHSYKQQLINNKQIQKQEITNNENSHKYKNINNEHLLMQKENSKVVLSATRQVAILTGEAARQQQRRIEATTVQIRSVTSFHQRLIERNERLIYGIELVEKKKTPRARKLSLVPVVKLSYRVLPEEQRKSYARVSQAQLAQELDRRSKDTNSKDSNRRSVSLSATSSSQLSRIQHVPLLSQVQGVRRQAQLVYTENRKHELRVDRHTKEQDNERTTKQTIQQVKDQITKQTMQQVKDQITKQVTQQVNEQISKQVTQQGNEQINQQVTEHVTQQVTQPVEIQNKAIVQQPSVSAIVATNKGYMKQAINSFSSTMNSITERPQYNQSFITGQLTHISKVNKTQLQQVKVLQSKLKQLQATTQVVSKQLVYRQLNSSSPGQLSTLITELQKTKIQTIQNSNNNIVVIDVPGKTQLMSLTSTKMNFITTNKNNLIHSSQQQQQSERLTKRLKQLGGATLLSKVKDMISTQTPLSIVQMRQTNEQDFTLIVNEQYQKRSSQIVKQVNSHTQSSMNLHVAKQQSTQQDDSQQLNAMKQLEVTVKRLEQEISVAKETTIQPSINIRQLSDQLFDQISRKIRLEQHRNGR